MKRKDMKIENEIGVAIVCNKEEKDAEGYQVHKEGSGDKNDSNNNNTYK